MHLLHRNIILGLACAWASTLAGCAREHKPAAYVARVGRAELTAEDISRRLGADSTAARRAEQYVNEWIIGELLFQEAERRGLTTTEELDRQMQATRKRLAIAALLEAEVYRSMDTLRIPDNEVAAYVRQAPEDFALREDVAHVSIALFAGRNAANSFRSLLVGGLAWEDAVHRASGDTAVASHPLRTAPDRYVTRSSLYPAELWKLTSTLRTGEVSFPVRSQDGYYILQLHSLKRTGDTPDLAYIRDAARNRMLMEERQRRYERLLAGLRARARVDVRLGTTDSADASRHQGEAAR